MDFGAVLAMAEAMQAPVWLVADVLPDIEAALMAGLSGAGPKSEDDD